MQIVSNKKKYVVLYIPNYLLNLYIRMGTLRSLVSVLFYQTTWSEFLPKVSIKPTGPSQKKSIVLFYFSAARANFWSLLKDIVGIFGKSLYQTTSTIFLSNSSSLERPGLIIDSLEYIQYTLLARKQRHALPVIQSYCTASSVESVHLQIHP